MLEHSFMIRAFLAGGMIAIIAPAIGMFLVQRRMSFLVDTLAHVSLAGIAIGLILAWQPIATAAAVAVAGALLADWLRAKGKMEGDAALVLLMYGSLAVASILLSTTRGPVVSLESLLFGSILTVRPSDLWLIVLLGCVVGASIILFYRPLFCVVFDEEWAQTIGLSAGRLNAILIVLAALTVALSMRIVGALLVGALMIIPCVAATKLRRGYFITLLISIATSLTAVLSGIVLSYHIGWPSGGTIVVVMLVAVIVFSAPGAWRTVRKSAQRNSKRASPTPSGRKPPPTVS